MRVKSIFILIFVTCVIGLNAQINYKNIAIGKPTAASGEYSQTYPSSAAVDDSEETAWGSPIANAPQWLYIDLESKTDIDSVDVVWYGIYFATRYQIYTSDNLMDWTLLVDVTNNTSNMQSHDIPTSCRYVGIYCIEKNSVAYGLAEFRILQEAATPTPTATATPTAQPTPTMTPIPGKTFIISHMGDGLDKEDFFVMGDIMKSLGYREVISETTLTADELLSYINRPDITYYYHTGHGYIGSVSTDTKPVKHTEMLVNTQNVFFATCLTLWPWDWQDYVGPTGMSVMGYTAYSYDFTDTKVCRDMGTSLQAGNSITRAFYDGNLPYSNVNSVWKILRREGNSVVQYLPNGGIPPRGVPGDMTFVEYSADSGVLRVSENLLDSRNEKHIDVSGFKKYTINRSSIEDSKGAIDLRGSNDEFLAKSVADEDQSLRVAEAWLAANYPLPGDAELDKILPIASRDDSTVPEMVIAHSIYYRRVKDGYGLASTGKADYINVLVNDGRVVSYAYSWNEFSVQDAALEAGALLTSTEAIGIAAQTIANAIKGGTATLVDVEPCYGQTTAGLVPAYRFIDSEGRHVVVSALDGSVIY